MRDCVVFKDYDKISDDLMYFGIDMIQSMMIMVK